jgi:hypothetical protein
VRAALAVLEREARMLARQRRELAAGCRSAEKQAVEARCTAIDSLLAEIELAAATLRDASR